MKYYKAAFSNAFDFASRESLKGFWFFFLLNSCILILLTIVEQFLVMAFRLPFGTFVYPYLCLVIVPHTSIIVRRLHDVGFSGWVVLVNVIPILGFIILMMLMAVGGDSESNKYGKPAVSF